MIIRMHSITTNRPRGRPMEVHCACIKPIVFNADRLEELESNYPNQSRSEIIRDLIEKKLEDLSKKNPDGSDRAIPIGDVYKYEGPKQTTLEDYFHQPDRFVEDCFSKVTSERDRLVLIKQFSTAVARGSNRRRHELNRIASWRP